jgi:hypothetical protein
VGNSGYPCPGTRKRPALVWGRSPNRPTEAPSGRAVLRRRRPGFDADAPFRTDSVRAGKSADSDPRTLNRSPPVPCSLIPDPCSLIPDQPVPRATSSLPVSGSPSPATRGRSDAEAEQVAGGSNQGLTCDESDLEGSVSETNTGGGERRPVPWATPFAHAPEEWPAGEAIQDHPHLLTLSL